MQAQSAFTTQQGSSSNGVKKGEGYHVENERDDVSYTSDEEVPRYVKGELADAKIDGFSIKKHRDEAVPSIWTQALPDKGMQSDEEDLWITRMQLGGPTEEEHLQALHLLEVLESQVENSIMESNQEDSDWGFPELKLEEDSEMQIYVAQAQARLQKLKKGEWSCGYQVKASMQSADEGEEKHVIYLPQQEEGCLFLEAVVPDEERGDTWNDLMDLVHEMETDIASATSTDDDQEQGGGHVPNYFPHDAIYVKQVEIEVQVGLAKVQRSSKCCLIDPKDVGIERGNQEGFSSTLVHPLGVEGDQVKLLRAPLMHKQEMAELHAGVVLYEGYMSFPKTNEEAYIWLPIMQEIEVVDFKQMGGKHGWESWLHQWPFYIGLVEKILVGKRPRFIFDPGGHV